MPNVIKMGRVPEPETPWWANTTIICEICESAFLLEQSDFDDELWVERQERKPGGAHTVEGRCPVCKAPMLIDVRALLAKTAHYHPMRRLEAPDAAGDDSSGYDGG